jgi:modulator of FtsH protease HflK
MSNEQKTPAPVTPVDTGSQALAEALRSSFGIVKFVMVLLFVLFLASGFFTVGPQEKAILLRFGKPVGEGDKVLLGPGLHLAWPYPIDEVIKIPITEIQKLTAKGCWFFQTPEQEALGEDPAAGPSLNPALDGYAITADGNIIHTKATLSYRIEDPKQCVFGFAAGTNRMFSLAGVSNAVLNALDNALVQTAARFKVDDLLLNDRVGFQDAVQRRFAKLVQEQKLGVTVDQCIVESRPPRQLKQAFDNVSIANQKRTTVTSAARSEASQKLGRAESDAVGRLNAAETARTLMVEGIRSEADRFQKVLPAYQSNPDLFVQQRLVETMGRVFANAQDKLFLPTSPDGKPVELRLLLSREPPKAKTEETKP